MNHDEKYQAWKDRHRPLDVPADFSGDVMRRIYRQAAPPQKVRQNWFGFIEFLPRPVQFALLAAAALVGLGRFGFLFSVVLNP